MDWAGTSTSARASVGVVRRVAETAAVAVWRKLRRAVCSFCL